MKVDFYPVLKELAVRLGGQCSESIQTCPTIVSKNLNYQRKVITRKKRLN